MNRDRAERLILYLQDAEDALERANRAASGSAKEERLKFEGVLNQLIAVLRSDVWKPIYDEYPDLAPEYESLEPPTIKSECAGMKFSFRLILRRKTSMISCSHC